MLKMWTKGQRTWQDNIPALKLLYLYSTFVHL